MLLDQLKWKTVTTLDVLPTDAEEPSIQLIRDKMLSMVEEGKTDGIEEREQIDEIVQITRYWISEEAANEWVSFINGTFPEGRFLIANIFEVV